MTTTAIPFVPLGTKLNPPTGARRRVTRLALIDRLVSGEPRRLTLVSAPAGWGKTTLLAEWASDLREQRRFAWFTVDQSDSDPVRFWAYVIAALGTVRSGLGESALPVLRAPGLAIEESALLLLLNELAGGRGQSYVTPPGMSEPSCSKDVLRPLRG